MPANAARGREHLYMAIVKTALEESPRDPSLFAKYPLSTGIAVGVATLVPHAFLTPEASRAFAAIVVALIAGIYFGFGVGGGSPRQQVIEFNVTGLFATAGFLGFLLWPILLPVARDWSLVAIPTWYVPWCVVIDVIVGAGLLWMWMAHGLL